jgi:hypothetical protein
VGYLPAAETPDEVPFVEGQALPLANPGEGWKLICRPAVYKTVSEQVETSPARSYLEPIPAKWETRNETIQVSPETKVLSVVPAKHETESFRVMTKPESTRLEIIPARYENAQETVVIEAAREETRTIPATYRTESERIEVAPAYTFWKRSGGGEKTHSDKCGHCVEKISGDSCSKCGEKVSKDFRCGDEFSLCEVPAKFVTVCKQVIDKEATTASITIPARTKTVCVQRLVADADVRKVVCPAEYATLERGVCGKSEVTTCSIPAKFETVCKQVMVTPASSFRVEIPAKYETICRQVLDQPATTVWRRIKGDCPTAKSTCAPIKASCETKSTCSDVVKRYSDVPGTDEASLLALKRK